MEYSVINDALHDEIKAINSIYGPLALKVSESSYNSFKEKTVVLQIPDQPFSFNLTFDTYYPETPPLIRGIQSASDRPKGEGNDAVEILNKVLTRVFKTGEEVLYDLIEEGGGALMVARAENDHKRELEEKGAIKGAQREESGAQPRPPETFTLAQPPQWILSDVMTEKKSVFVARCVAAKSTERARQCIDHLLTTHKKVAGATHNITAWRIRGSNGTIIQDSDDDGESAAGGRLLHLLQLMDAWDVVVVVTRWYGGIKLGPDRFRVINTVARDALVKGGFNNEQKTKKKSKNSWRPDNDSKRAA